MVELLPAVCVTPVVAVFIVPFRSPKNVGDVTVPAKVALPPSEPSKVKAITFVVPSFTLNLISLSLTLFAKYRSFPVSFSTKESAVPLTFSIALPVGFIVIKLPLTVMFPAKVDIPVAIVNSVTAEGCK